MEKHVLKYHRNKAIFQSRTKVKELMGIVVCESCYDGNTVLTKFTSYITSFTFLPVWEYLLSTIISKLFFKI